MKELILLKLTLEESGIVSNTRTVVAKRLSKEEMDRVKSLTNEIAQIFKVGLSRDI